MYRAWTDPTLLKQWFAPLPYTTPVAELDVRPGGASLIVMRAPDGTELPNRGVYLEVLADRKLVVTDAYTEAWQPSHKPFMTVIVTFDAECGRTRYMACCAIGPWPIATRTRRWASTKVGANALISSRRWWRSCEAASASRRSISKSPQPQKAPPPPPRRTRQAAARNAATRSPCSRQSAY